MPRRTRACPHEIMLRQPLYSATKGLRDIFGTVDRLRARAISARRDRILSRDNIGALSQRPPPASLPKKARNFVALLHVPYHSKDYVSCGLRMTFQHALPVDIRWLAREGRTAPEWVVGSSLRSRSRPLQVRQSLRQSFFDYHLSNCCLGEANSQDPQPVLLNQDSRSAKLSTVLASMPSQAEDRTKD